MHGGFRVGKLFGITVTIDWSWLLIFVLIAWDLSSTFGQVDPQWSVGFQWTMAILAALLFFASVLAHEFAHSLVARARGIDVRSITLFLFGGVSNIQRDPDTPGAEFIITIVGPLTSLLLGFLMLLVAGVGVLEARQAITNPLNLMSQLSPFATMMLVLGSVNVALGIFNLIPGFPLDGGRILRSILWKITGNVQKATRWASWVGQVIAWLLIVGGVAMIFGITIPFFGTGFLSGLWLVFIGWFLNSASAQSYRQVLLEHLLEGVPVSRLMRPNPQTVPPVISVGSLVHDHIMGSDERSFPVVQGDQLVGLVTLDDVRRVTRDKWDVTHVSDIMTPADKLATAEANEESSEALQKLMQRDVNQIPVLENGNLVGLLRRQDIIRWLQVQSGGSKLGQQPL